MSASLPLLVDTHCHLDFHRFDEDRDVVIQRAVEIGVAGIVVPGLDIPSSRAAIDLAERYPGIFAAVGVHPNEIGANVSPDLASTISTLKKLAQHPKVIALGEIGLDYYWDKTPAPVQHQWLKAQLELASELELPVILHNRDSTDDILLILEEWTAGGLPASLKDRPGVLHSFSATWEDAQRALALNFYLGFTGPITFKKADEMRRVAAKTPEERILIETDAPFLSPHPERGNRNEPAFVRHTATKLAEIRGVDFETIARITTRNAIDLFGVSFAPTES